MSNGAYLSGGSCDTIVFGGPIVVSPILPIGTFLIGDNFGQDVSCERVAGGDVITVDGHFTGQVRVGQALGVNRNPARVFLAAEAPCVSLAGGNVIKVDGNLAGQVRVGEVLGVSGQPGRIALAAGSEEIH